MPSSTVPKRPTLEKRASRFLKHVGRPALNRFLARYSEVGDPVVFDNALFPWTRVFEDHYDAIRDEAETLMTLRDALPAFYEVSPYQKRISTDQWKTLWLYGFGRRSEVACALCPVTASLIDEVPGLQSALFSILAPGVHIPEHRGVFKGLVNYHLGVIIPEKSEMCCIRVGDESFHWEAGKSYVFDDTNAHEVWNESGQERVVLFLQFERPLRSPGRQVSRAFVSLLRRTPYLRVPMKNAAALDEKLRVAAVERGLL